MADKKILDTRKIFKTTAIVYAAIFAVGIIFTVIFGVKLDINFSGGTRLSYTYDGDMDSDGATAAVKSAVDRDFTVSQNTSIAGNTKTLTVSFAGNKSLDTESQDKVLKNLQEKFPENNVELSATTSVNPTVAGTFMQKCIVAMLITAILVVIYVGIRFRKIGGISAAITALAALVLDVLVSFFTCAIFRLQIDSNYIAVVLTILGYSLNDTIVIYDRVRENRRIYPGEELQSLVDRSISSVLVRNIVTTVTTLAAVFTIILVSELFGLTSLRTFAIPMAFGLASGCFSSLFISGPLWVYWQNKKAAKDAETKAK